MNNLLRLIGRRLVALPIMAVGRHRPGVLPYVVLQDRPAYTALGDGASPEAVAEYHEKYGLDDPWPVRYVRYMGDLIHGDMGTYGAARNSVAKRISTALPVTMQLTFIGLAIGAVVSFFARRHRGTVSRQMAGPSDPRLFHRRLGNPVVLACRSVDPAVLFLP